MASLLSGPMHSSPWMAKYIYDCLVRQEISDRPKLCQVVGVSKNAESLPRLLTLTDGTNSMLAVLDSKLMQQKPSITPSRGCFVRIEGWTLSTVKVVSEHDSHLAELLHGLQPTTLCLYIKDGLIIVGGLDQGIAGNPIDIHQAVEVARAKQLFQTATALHDAVRKIAQVDGVHKVTATARTEGRISARDTRNLPIGNVARLFASTTGPLDLLLNVEPEDDATTTSSAATKQAPAIGYNMDGAPSVAPPRNLNEMHSLFGQILEAANLMDQGDPLVPQKRPAVEASTMVDDDSEDDNQEMGIGKMLVQDDEDEELEPKAARASEIEEIKRLVKFSRHQSRMRAVRPNGGTFKIGATKGEIAAAIYEAYPDDGRSQLLLYPEARVPNQEAEEDIAEEDKEGALGIQKQAPAQIASKLDKMALKNRSDNLGSTSTQNDEQNSPTKTLDDQGSALRQSRTYVGGPLGAYGGSKVDAIKSRIEAHTYDSLLGGPAPSPKQVGDRVAVVALKPPPNLTQKQTVQPTLASKIDAMRHRRDENEADARDHDTSRQNGSQQLDDSDDERFETQPAMMLFDATENHQDLSQTVRPPRMVGKSMVRVTGSQQMFTQQPFSLPDVDSDVEILETQPPLGPSMPVLQQSRKRRRHGEKIELTQDRWFRVIGTKALKSSPPSLFERLLREDKQ